MLNGRRLLGCAAAAAIAALSLPVEAASFRYSTSGDLLTMDPHWRNEGPTNAMKANLYDGLVGRTADLQVAAELAESFTVPDAAAPHRSPAWVNWLLTTEFNDVPSRKKNLYLVRHRGSEVISGYVLTKQRHFDDVTQRHVKNVTIAAVQDWMSFDPDTLPEHHLLALAISAALNPVAGATADAVEVCTAVPAEQRALKRWGLLCPDVHKVRRIGSDRPQRLSLSAGARLLGPLSSRLQCIRAPLNQKRPSICCDSRLSIKLNKAHKG